MVCAPASVQAHTFGQLYTLPVPLWLYAWGASAALLVSFLVAAYFLATGPATTVAASRDRSGWLDLASRWRLGPIFSGLALCMLLLAIATALFGTTDPRRNFSMLSFWILFVLGYTYLTALTGNTYAVINPWRSLALGIGRFRPGYLKGRWHLPERLDVWPALLLYFGFICYELFGWVRPPGFGAMLAGYTVLNLVGVWAVGAGAWFSRCELFSVLLRLFSLLSPLDIRHDAEGRVRLATRPVGAGALNEQPSGLPMVLFVLFMLASTGFDGLHATEWWFQLFWRDPTGIVTALAGAKPLAAYVALRPWYVAWSVFGLALLPLLYFGLYLLALQLARWFARSGRSLRELALAFAFPLIPIVLVYHVTHYFTLVIADSTKFLSLLSDPFGWHWDLFGTREKFRATLMLDMDLVWHLQVGLIVLGHVSSVVLSHRVALRLFGNRWRALLSQLPMLLLMVGFTVFGLWILAQPLQSTIVR